MFTSPIIHWVCCDIVSLQQLLMVKAHYLLLRLNATISWSACGTLVPSG